MTTKKKIVSKVVKVERKVLGVAANIKNLLIAIAMLFAFIGGFFQVYSWMETTYAKSKQLHQVKVENDYRWENTVLNGMYSRFCALDNIINFALDPTKVDPEKRAEYTELKAKIKLQEDVVKDLEKKRRE